MYTVRQLLIVVFCVACSYYSIPLLKAAGSDQLGAIPVPAYSWRLAATVGLAVQALMTVLRWFRDLGRFRRGEFCLKDADTEVAESVSDTEIPRTPRRRRRGMTSGAIIAVFFVLRLVLMLSGMPIAYSLGIASAGYMLMSGTSLAMMAQRMVNGANSFTMLAIPFFFMAGELMNISGVTDKIINMAKALVGHFKGRLGSGEHRGQRVLLPVFPDLPPPTPPLWARP